LVATGNAPHKPKVPGVKCVVGSKEIRLSRPRQGTEEKEPRENRAARFFVLNWWPVKSAVACKPERKGQPKKGSSAVSQSC